MLRRLPPIFLALVFTLGLQSAAGAARAPKLTSLLLRNGEMHGFVVVGRPASATGASSFVKHVYRESGSIAKAQAQTLALHGFVAGATENLSPKKVSSPQSGLSAVLQFVTAGDARIFASTSSSQAMKALPTGTVIKPVTIKVKGTQAFSATFSGESEANAYVPAGRCLFVVSDFVNGTTPNPVPLVVQAAKTLHKRVASACS